MYQKRCIPPSGILSVPLLPRSRRSELQKAERLVEAKKAFPSAYLTTRVAGLGLS